MLVQVVIYGFTPHLSKMKNMSTKCVYELWKHTFLEVENYEGTLHGLYLK